jgi:tRNA-specific 2-thiouridylase
LKFDFLTKQAEELGAAFVATGHYARIQNPKSSDAKVQLWTTASEILNPKQSQISKYKLLKGNDPTKDQSYFLYVMSQQSLSKTLFPIGDLEKKEVRKIAKGLALTVAEKKESQEICFVNNDYRDFLKANIPNALKKGDIIDTSGKKVGTHDGILFYTIGQRRGIGAHLEKKYVVSLDIKNNTVTIGNNSDLMKTTLTAENLNFISGELPMDGLEVLAKIRYNSPGSPAKISIIDKDKVKVEFEKPQRAVTPGQSVVFYLGDEVLGGGIISA